MSPFVKATGFDWNTGDENKNAKHGVTPAEAEQVFLNEPLVVMEDVNHSDLEQRFHTLGHTSEGRLLHITLTIRTSKIRVISVRDMHRKERTAYEQEA